MSRRSVLIQLLVAGFIGAVFAPVCLAQTAIDQFSIAAGFYSRQEWPEAVTNFEQLITHFPNTEQANEGYFFLGESQLQQGNYPLARIAYQKFIARQNDSKFRLRATFRLGELAYRTKDQQAVPLLESFIVRNPDAELVQFALAYLGEVRLERNEPQLARKVFEQALEHYPDSSMMLDCRLGLANALRQLGEPQEAKGHYEFLVEEGTPEIQSKVRFQLGLLQFADKEWNGAITQFQAIVDDPTEGESNVEAIYWLGRCYLETGEHQEAIATFEQLTPDQLTDTLGPAVYFDGAVAWAQTGQFTEAENWLQKIRTVWPQSQRGDDALQLEIEIAQRTEQFDVAEHLSNRFLVEYAQSPLLPKVTESLGRAKYDRKDYEGSIGIFKSLMRNTSDSEDPFVIQQRNTWRYLIGLSYIGLEDFQSASQTLGEIQTPIEPELVSAVSVARATARAAHGDYHGAITDYQKYLTGNPVGDQIDRCLSELTVCHAELKEWKKANDAFAWLQGDYPESQYLNKTASYLATAALEDKQHGLATGMFERLILPGNSDEDISKGLKGLAWAYHNSGDSQKAVAHFHRIVNEHPNVEFTTDAAMAHAKHLEDAKNYQTAGEIYGLVTNNTHDQRMVNISRLRIAHCMQKLGGSNNLNAAKIALTDYLASETEREHVDEAVYQLAWVYKDLGLEGPGFNYFEQLANDYPNSKYWADAAYRVAEQKFKIKDFAGAQKLSAELMEKVTQPEILARSLYLYGQVAAMNDQWTQVQGAMTQLNQRTQDKGIYAKSNYWLAESMYQQGRYSESSSIFGQLLQKSNLLDSQTWPWVALRYSQCNAKLGNWDQVKPNSVQSVQQYRAFAKNYEHQYLIGRALEQDGRLDEARERYERVVASKVGGQSETAAKAQWRIGETFFHQERFKEAIQAFYKVDSLFTHDKWRSAAIYEAGKCQEHLGNWSKAVILYQQILDEFPQCEFLSEATKRLEFSNRQAATTNQNKRR